jgi:broad specificity phosphatase PhoE
MLEVARKTDARKIALVSHMWVTKSIVTDAMNILPHEQEKWEQVSIPTASISV